MQRSVRVDRVGHQVLLVLALPTARLALIVHLVASKVEQTHSDLANVHGQLPSLQSRCVELYC
jgi:hypothetical protein